MSRVIIFSQEFPSYHPRKGEPTYFVDKIWAWKQPPVEVMANFYAKMNRINKIHGNYQPKNHTLRAGYRWKEGDWFSPRVWSGTPYRSKQVIIGPDIQVKKVWKVIIDEFYNVSIPSKDENLRRLGYRSLIPAGDVAKNDGLSYLDFKYWFPKEFNGQIICWNENVNY